MFEIPRAKRVRREELHDSDSSRQGSPDDTTVDTFRAALLDYEIVQPVIETPRTINQDEGDEEEAEFNLFAKPNTGVATQPTKISLRSPSPDADGKFVVARRSHDYYFTGSMTAARWEQFRLAALSGQDVQRLATAYWPGSAYPWKVTTLPHGRDRAATEATTFSLVAGEKRKRPGKKGRMKKRKAQAAETLLKEAEKAAKEDKERAEREKRARRNREKKFKKRARDKAKKQGGGMTGEAMNEGDGGESSDGDSQAA